MSASEFEVSSLLGAMGRETCVPGLHGKGLDLEHLWYRGLVGHSQNRDEAPWVRVPRTTTV